MDCLSSKWKLGQGEPGATPLLIFSNDLGSLDRCLTLVGPYETRLQEKHLYVPWVGTRLAIDRWGRGSGAQREGRREGKRRGGEAGEEEK